MNLPIKIISVKSLMKNWGMTFYDVFLMACIYNLTPVYQEGGKWKYWDEREEDWMELFFPQTDGAEEEIHFLRSDVSNLEQRMGKPITKSMQIIDEESLLERWDISQTEFWSLEDEYPVRVDPLGETIEAIPELENHLLSYPNSDEIKFYFRLSDIEQFEKKHGIKPTDRVVGIPEEPKKKAHNEMCKKKCQEIAVRRWAEDPTITIRDMIDSQEIVDAAQKKDGSLYLEKTIRDWIKHLCPDRKPGRRPKKKR